MKLPNRQSSLESYTQLGNWFAASAPGGSPLTSTLAPIMATSDYNYGSIIIHYYWEE
jgi:hypothetical protein